MSSCWTDPTMLSPLKYHPNLCRPLSLLPSSGINQNTRSQLLYNPSMSGTTSYLPSDRRSSHQKSLSASPSTSLEWGDSAQQTIMRNTIDVDASTSGAQWQSTRFTANYVRPGSVTSTGTRLGP